MQLQCILFNDRGANAVVLTPAILHSRDSNSIVFVHSQINPKTKIGANTGSSVLSNFSLYISDWVAIPAGPTFSSMVNTGTGTEWLVEGPVIVSAWAVTA